jgi:hypothetical protein
MTQVSDGNEEVDYRRAGHDDETDILAVLKEVAPEIPVKLDTQDKLEKIQTVITECHGSGKSWVAVSASSIPLFRRPVLASLVSRLSECQGTKGR